MLVGLTTPGSRSSEFLVTVLNVAAQIGLAWSGEIATGTAVKLGTAGAIAYAISRGLAKYENRPTAAAATPQQGPPAA